MYVSFERLDIIGAHLSLTPYASSRRLQAFQDPLCNCTESQNKHDPYSNLLSSPVMSAFRFVLACVIAPDKLVKILSFSMIRVKRN